MGRSNRASVAWALTVILGMLVISSYAEDTASESGLSYPKVTFSKNAGQVDVLIGSQAVATYVYEDKAILRPFFCQVKTLQGVLVTRHNPPDPVVNRGNDDHPTMHPGLWLAFGDLNGGDYWRNKARVRHEAFAEPFVETCGMGQFAVVNSYEADGGPGAPVCRERCIYTFRVEESGYFILMESTFSSDTADFSFGDQEEMGVGVRLNTPLTVKFGSGTICNDEGGRNEKETWGKPSRWCAYSGIMDGERAGVCLMPAPGNFRPSWFHTRDYGLLVANAFGRKSMTGPEDATVTPDRTVVRKGEPFRVGYGVYIFGGPAELEPDFAHAYDAFLTATENR